MRILISGACGFIGKPLSLYLREKGHQIIRLQRQKHTDSDSIFWDPENGVIVKELFEGFDAVIHLAGENIASRRWTKSQMRKILLSRTVGTFLLAYVLSQLYRPPRVFISPSAVGYYGNRLDEELDDESLAGAGFLANVCCEWEKAAESLSNRGCRVIHPRMGMVLGHDGGILQKLLLPYKLGLGGKWGSGRQWVSWVALEDVLRAYEFTLSDERLEGSFNLTSPHPVRQEEFSRALSHILHRPDFFNLPASLLRFLCARMADELLLASAKVMPSKLLDQRFDFRYPTLDMALGAILI